MTETMPSNSIKTKTERQQCGLCKGTGAENEFVLRNVQSTDRPNPKPDLSQQ